MFKKPNNVFDSINDEIAAEVYRALLIPDGPNVLSNRAEVVVGISKYTGLYERVVEGGLEILERIGVICENPDFVPEDRSFDHINS